MRNCVHGLNYFVQQYIVIEPVKCKRKTCFHRYTDVSKQRLKSSRALTCNNRTCNIKLRWRYLLVTLCKINYEIRNGKQGCRWTFKYKHWTLNDNFYKLKKKISANKTDCFYTRCEEIIWGNIYKHFYQVLVFVHNDVDIPT